MVMKWEPSLMTDVFALAHDAETTLFQRPHCKEMINAGNFRHC
jgi:hypothetical protein